MEKYKRILLKLSGESLMGEQAYGIDAKRLGVYAEEIAACSRNGCQIAIVIGGGNIFRGLQGAAKGMDRIQGDYMGMMATLINSMALQAELGRQGVEAELLSGLAVDPICARMSSRRAIAALEAGKVVIMAAGTGNPFFTTDTGAALRAAEVKADVLLKGTRVDGVYTADPEKDPTATKYDRLTFDEAYNRGLKIMDLTAFTLCKENNVPIYVFNMDVPGNLLKVVSGEPIGTLIEA
ncbi:MAG: UMP kinase [Bacteroidales bacterium]|nr:UMP kinase [Bacteroidales bacterium]